MITLLIVFVFGSLLLRAATSEIGGAALRGLTILILLGTVALFSSGIIWLIAVVVMRIAILNKGG